jgi:predicted glycosyl hydrolase (DUF1957 family)
MKVPTRHVYCNFNLENNLLKSITYNKFHDYLNKNMSRTCSKKQNTEKEVLSRVKAKSRLKRGAKNFVALNEFIVNFIHETCMGVPPVL